MVLFIVFILLAHKDENMSTPSCRIAVLRVHITTRTATSTALYFAQTTLFLSECRLLIHFAHIKLLDRELDTGHLALTLYIYRTKRVLSNPMKLLGITSVTYHLISFLLICLVYYI
jgi:hypothetical protein